MWLSYQKMLNRALELSRSEQGPTKILIVTGSARMEKGCAAEKSKAIRLANYAAKAIEDEGAEAKIINLARMTVEEDKTIGPCKGCYSTSPALCHFGCSCYNSVEHDWMRDEIYELLLGCHGLLIITPVYWFSMPSPLKLMIDRMVCLDGANPDIESTTTNGSPKDSQKAKELERGEPGGESKWDYLSNKTMAGKYYATYVYGDANDEGAALTSLSLQKTFEWMGMKKTNDNANAMECIGCLMPYSDSHEHLDQENHVWNTVEMIARSLARHSHEAKEQGMPPPDMPPNEMQK